MTAITLSINSYLKIKLHANGKGEIPLKRYVFKNNGMSRYSAQAIS